MFQYVRRLFAGFTLWCVLAVPVWAQSQLSIENAVAIALEASPALMSTDAQAKALFEQIEQVGALPDPRLTVGLANLPGGSFSLDEDPMSQLKIGFSQALPFPGKLALKEKTAQQRAEAAESVSALARLNLVRDVKQRWWQLFYFDRALETVERNRELLAQLLETAETQYIVGQGQQHNVLLAQLEQTKLDNELLQLQEKRVDVVAQLNRLLDRDPLTPVVLPKTEAGELPSLCSSEQLQIIALEHRPDLHALEAQVEAARSMRELSTKDQYPDFAVGASYGIRDGRDDLTSIQFFMSLPIYSGRKQSRAEDQRQAELMASRYRLQEAQTEVASQVAIISASYQRARQQASLYKQSMLPQARQTVESMLASYQVHKVDFSTLLQAQLNLYKYETQYWQAYSIAKQSQAKLAAAVGKESVDE